jgi:hypothetical protein
LETMLPRRQSARGQSCRIRSQAPTLASQEAIPEGWGRSSPQGNSLQILHVRTFGAFASFRFLVASLLAPFPVPPVHSHCFACCWFRVASLSAPFPLPTVATLRLPPGVSESPRFRLRSHGLPFASRCLPLPPDSLRSGVRGAVVVVMHRAA